MTLTEYVIHDGPGTLLIRNHRSGVQSKFPELMDAGRLLVVVGLRDNLTMRRASPDCVTGQ